MLSLCNVFLLLWKVFLLLWITAHFRETENMRKKVQIHRMSGLNRGFKFFRLLFSFKKNKQTNLSEETKIKETVVFYYIYITWDWFILLNSIKKGVKEIITLTLLLQKRNLLSFFPHTARKILFLTEGNTIHGRQIWLICDFLNQIFIF